MPIEEIENPMEEDDEDQMVVVGAADESLESPKVQPLRFEMRKVRSAHFEYKSDEEEKEEEPVASVVQSEIVPLPETVSVTEAAPQLAEDVQIEEEVEFVPILRAKAPAKRVAVRHDDEIVTKRQVGYSISMSMFE